MRVRERARRHTEETRRTAGLEVDTHHMRVRPAVDLEGAVVATGRDRAVKPMLPTRRVVDAEGVFVEVDDELDGSARDDAFTRVARSVAQRPERVDDVVERSAWLV